MSWVVSTTEHECPNCHSKYTTPPPKLPETMQRGEGYSLLRGEDYLDGDAVPYVEARNSEEEIGVESNADVEDKGKGSIKI